MEAVIRNSKIETKKRFGTELQRLKKLLEKLENSEPIEEKTEILHALNILNSIQWTSIYNHFNKTSTKDRIWAAFDLLMATSSFILKRYYPIKNDEPEILIEIKQYKQTVRDELNKMISDDKYPSFSDLVARLRNIIALLEDYN